MIKKHTSLKEWCEKNNSNLLNDWDKSNELSPNDFSFSSSKKVIWKCPKCNNSYKASIHNRVKRKSGCPYCANKKVKIGFNDLKTLNPKLAEEWNYEKNGELRPENVVEYYSKKVWWKCKKCGSEWQSSPNQRHKTNCPYCGTSHRLTKYKDSIENKYPHLLKEWDYEKNKILPSQCSRSSDKIVWWKCNEGHSWKTAIKVRTKGSNCPYCSNRKVLIGYNDLFTTNPKLKDEWDFENNKNINPNNLTFGSNKKVNWVCSKCGNKWKAIIATRSKGYGCPKCMAEQSVISRLKNNANKNSFKDNYPNLVKEWDFEKNDIDISLIAVSSNKRVWWKCKEGHSWRASVCQRTTKKTNCPYCDGQRVLVGINDLQTLNSELAKEWDFEKNYPLKPSDVCFHSGKNVWWKCEKCGHQWKAKINNRANGRDCPNCNSNGTSFIEQTIYFYIKKIFNDAKNRHLIDNTELDIYIPSINTAIEYDGAYFHSVKNSEQREAKKDLYCKNNNIKLIRLREKPLKKTLNAINIECDCSNWIGLENTINDLFNYLNIKEDIDISIKNDLIEIIKNKKELINKKSFGETYQNVLNEWDYEKNYPLLPNYFSKGSDVKVWWKCAYGHQWEAKIANRCKTKGSNCPICYEIKRKNNKIKSSN